MIRAIDISRAQDSIDWSDVADAGIKAVWIKASQGVKTSNDRIEYLKRNAEEASNAGLRVGVYHFASMSNASALAEADCNHSTVLKAGIEHLLKLPTMIDIEPHGTRDSWGIDSLDRSEVAMWASLWCKQRRRPCIIYTPLRSYLSHLERLGLPMWLASRPWGSEIPPSDLHSILKKAPAEHKWSVWQYASKAGHVPGIDGSVDLNIIDDEKGGIWT